MLEEERLGWVLKKVDFPIIKIKANTKKWNTREHFAWSRVEAVEQIDIDGGKGWKAFLNRRSARRENQLIGKPEIWIHYPLRIWILKGRVLTSTGLSSSVSIPVLLFRYGLFCLSPYLARVLLIDIYDFNLKTII
jgi:hypothetical protein